MLSFFCSRRNWDSPNPFTRRRVCPHPPPPGSGGRGTLAGERGVERVPIPTRGHPLWYSFIRTLWVPSIPHKLQIVNRRHQQRSGQNTVYRPLYINIYIQKRLVDFSCLPGALNQIYSQVQKGTTRGVPNGLRKNYKFNQRAFYVLVLSW